MSQQHLHVCHCGYEWDCNDWYCGPSALFESLLGKKITELPLTCGVCEAIFKLARAEEERERRLRAGNARMRNAEQV